MDQFQEGMYIGLRFRSPYSTIVMYILSPWSPRIIIQDGDGKNHLFKTQPANAIFFWVDFNVVRLLSLRVGYINNSYRLSLGAHSFHPTIRTDTDAPHIITSETQVVPI